MQTDTAAEYLLKKLNEQRETNALRIITGVSNIEEYRRLCGRIEVFDYCIALIKDTAHKAANEEELGDE
jgi:hypothetical protein